MDSGTKKPIHHNVDQILLGIVKEYIEKNFREFLMYPGTNFKKLQELFEN